jgi:site-specific recombinase XerD
MKKKLQVFFYHCVNIRKFAPATTNQYISALRTFYLMMAPEKKVIMDKFCKLRLEEKIPHILERSEVSALIRAIANIKHRAAIALMYSSGVRVSECVELKIVDVESSRMKLRVEHGKGAKDRYTVLSSYALTLLREYYLACHPQHWLFESSRVSGKHLSTATLTQVLKKAAGEAGITKRVYPHILRHCFATHLLENGVPLNVIQQYLGHRHLKTTCGYAHVTENLLRKIKSPADMPDMVVAHAK